jgi:hypothetical protein
VLHRGHEHYLDSLLLLLLLLACRRFWQGLLGGLTVLDLAVLCFITAMNIIWTCALLTHNWRMLLPKAALQGYAAPTNVGAWHQHGGESCLYRAT